MAILLDNILRYRLDGGLKAFLITTHWRLFHENDAMLSTICDRNGIVYLKMMSSILKQRLTAEPVRFVYQRICLMKWWQLLRSKLGLSNNDSNSWWSLS